MATVAADKDTNEARMNTILFASAGTILSLNNSLKKSAKHWYIGGPTLH
jgi:hypothetical protein